MTAIKRSFAACDKLTPPGVAQGEREMSLDISVEFHDEMRKLAHQNRVNNLPPRPEYWFRYFDGRVMLCEPVQHSSCGATITFFAQDESGAMVISNPGLEFMCVSHL